LRYDAPAVPFGSLLCRAFLCSRRHLRHGLQSNIVWTYANATIPRALRDVIVTEYGIADIRGKSDRDTIAAMICVADGNFQHQLTSSAQRAGKIERSFSLPSHRREPPRPAQGGTGAGAAGGAAAGFPARQ
jgi:acyl-CoA hydrolase